MRLSLPRSPFPVLLLPLLEHGLLLLCEQLSPAALPVSSPPHTVAVTHCLLSKWYAPAPIMPKAITAYAWPWKPGEGRQWMCGLAWLTLEDGSLLYAELEAACTESECAESEDGGEEGHGVVGGARGRRRVSKVKLWWTPLGRIEPSRTSTNRSFPKRRLLIRPSHSPIHSL